MTRPLPYEFIKIGLTSDRKELYKMIEERVDKMIEAGFVDEVKSLIERFTSSPIHPLTALQAIGYKEIAMYLNGEIPLEEAIRLTKRSTKRYAKRQYTWFNKEEDIHWIDTTGIQDVNEIFKRAWKILDGLINKAG